MDLSIIVPCYNEAENIPELARRVQEAMNDTGIAWELVLVNDGSTDATPFYSRKEFPHVRMIHHRQNLGMAEAWNSGAEAAYGDWIVTIDADLQYRPEDIRALWANQRLWGADFVQGVRTSANDTVRGVISRVWHSILSRGFGIEGLDLKSGMVLCKRREFLKLLSERRGFRFWQSFVRIAAERRGLHCREVPVSWYERKAGKSFLSGKLIRASLESFLLDLPRAIYLYR